VVIAAKLDRLFRSALDALEVHAQFTKRGIGLHLIDLGGDIANGLSKLFYTIAVAFAEAERDRIRERVLGTKADQKKRNRFLGGTAPFGWQVDEQGGLVEVPTQQAAIHRIIELRRGGMSLRQISAVIAKEGISLSHVGVKNVLAASQLGHSRMGQGPTSTEGYLEGKPWISS
jgi:putative DNA-invertase from lambdoid prophage Rac